MQVSAEIQSLLLSSPFHNPLNSPLWILDYTMDSNQQMVVSFLCFDEELTAITDVVLKIYLKRRKKPIVSHIVHLERDDQQKDCIVLKGTVVLEGVRSAVENLELDQLSYQNDVYVFTAYDYQRFSSMKKLGWDYLMTHRLDKRPVEVRSKKLKKIGIIAGSIVVGILAVTLILSVIFRQDIAYVNAKDSLKKQDYTKAISEFEALGSFKESPAYLVQSKFGLATQYFASKQYHEAYLLYSTLGDYQDSVSQSQRSLYEYGKMLIADGNYNQALDVFGNLSGYQDVDSLVNDIYYQRAVQFFDQKDYAQAQSEFKKLGTYKDSLKYYYIALDEYYAKTSTLPEGEFKPALQALYNGLASFQNEEGIASRLLSSRYWPVTLEGRWKTADGLFQLNVTVSSSGVFSITHDMQAFADSTAMKIEGDSILMKSEGVYKKWLDITMDSANSMRVKNYADDGTYTFVK